MAGLSYLKRAIDSSLYRRNAGSSVADLGDAFRVCFLSARAFSSVEPAEARNGQSHGVRSLLSEYGLTPEQVNKVSKSFPSIFSRNVETLSPKLAFLRSVLRDDVSRVVAADPALLRTSLNNKLMPNYKLIKSIVDRDELAAKIIKRSSRILRQPSEDKLAAKVCFLRESRVPCTSIAKLMEQSPRAFSISFCKLKDSVQKAMGFGFQPQNPMIVAAIKAISQMDESLWDLKVEVFRKWGWSDEDFLVAFRKQPAIMSLSEEKINKGMDLFLNTVGLSPSDIVKYPYLMSFSIEERIMPRCSVLGLLVAKGVLGDKPPKAATYAKALCLSEAAFVEMFVNKYPEHVLEYWLKVQRKAVVHRPNAGSPSEINLTLA